MESQWRIWDRTISLNVFDVCCRDPGGPHKETVQTLYCGILRQLHLIQVQTLHQSSFSACVLNYYPFLWISEDAWVKGGSTDLKLLPSKGKSLPVHPGHPLLSRKLFNQNNVLDKSPLTSNQVYLCMQISVSIPFWTIRRENHILAAMVGNSGQHLSWINKHKNLAAVNWLYSNTLCVLYFVSEPV